MTMITKEASFWMIARFHSKVLPGSLVTHSLSLKSFGIVISVDDNFCLVLWTIEAVFSHMNDAEYISTDFYL